MTNGLQLMGADDGTGVSGTRPERRFPAPPQPIGSPFHDIGKAVVAKRKLVARQAILSHAQLGRRTSPGESRYKLITAAKSYELLTFIYAAPNGYIGNYTNIGHLESAIWSITSY